MFNPKQLVSLGTVNEQLVRSLLDPIAPLASKFGIYDYLVYLMIENIEAQKKTLAAFQWDSNEFVENSDSWMEWVKLAATKMPPDAVFSEEIWHTLELWQNTSSSSLERFNSISSNNLLTLGRASGAHFAIFDSVLENFSSGFGADPQRQAAFIETLQHERVHVYTRYWKLLKYDIPYATTLGLLAAKERLEHYGYEYDYWQHVLSKRSRRLGLGRNTFSRRDRFLKFVSRIKSKYSRQIENQASYVDGSDLAMVANHYFGDVSKARMFIELVAFGIKIEEAETAAQKGETFRVKPKRFYSFSKDEHRLRMSGWWNPGTGKGLNGFANSVMHLISVRKYSELMRNAGAKESDITLLFALRGADQKDANLFRNSDERYKVSAYFSLPHCTYSSAPLSTPLSSQFDSDLRGDTSWMRSMGEYERLIQSRGLTPDQVPGAIQSGRLSQQDVRLIDRANLEINIMHQKYSKLYQLTSKMTQSPQQSFLL